ncbi:MAG: sulfatase [Planctomycetaceae bacterium]|nr:sulfatase [Planctomycetaceae bacterium]
MLNSLPDRIRSVAIQIVLTAVSLLNVHSSVVSAQDEKVPPNIVFIFCDNLGYGDPGCYGSTVHRTPRIDQLAAEGLKLTSFYAASGVCTPSRAALMTGCYPRRVGLHLTDPDGAVLRPVSPNGLNPNEVTIAEVLKQGGYATACIGKWHLGDQLPFLPTRQGFDLFFGIPYSDDMTQRNGQPWPPLPLMRNEQVIEAPVDRNQLTRRYTEAAIEFIRDHQQQPFLLYLPHAMPGSTAEPFASESFRGKSQNGAYGDSVEEIDWSTGVILDTLDELNLSHRTLVIWTSDNGAPHRNPPQGSNAPLGGWGYSVMEGGMRVPCLIRQPGRIPAGSVSDEIVTTMDWLPTLAQQAHIRLAEDHTIDGHDVSLLLESPAEFRSPWEGFLYYYRDQVQAIRSGHWKLHLPRADRQVNLNGKVVQSPATLFDLDADIGEQNDVAASHPRVVEQLTKLAAELSREIGDGEQAGAGQRPVGRHESPEPRQLMR